MMTPEQYRRSMEHLQALPAVALVTTGRTGSDFLQSLLDSHPQVLTFNGSLQFYADFWPSSKIARTESFAIGDLLDEFVGGYLHRFRSRYDFAERKDHLGPDGSQALDIDTAAFRRHALALLEGRPLSARNILIAIYGAFHLCLDHDLQATRMLFHHAHRFDELALFLKDFPSASALVTTRDPRANFVAGIEHGRSLFKHRDNEQFLYHYLNGILDDSSPCAALGVRYAAVRLEDLPKESTMRAMAAWIGIDYCPSMLESTWGGLRWYGDRLSPKPIESNEWTPSRTDNNWRNRLSKRDLYLFNALMGSRLRHYGYPYDEPGPWDWLVVRAGLMRRLSHERRFFRRDYIREKQQSIRDRLVTYAYFVRRVARTLAHYGKTRKGPPFSGPWIGGPAPEPR